MNIQEQLFKIHNVVKHQSKDWDEVLEKESKSGEIAPMTMYYAAYYAGAYALDKILINLWNGDLTEEELDLSLKMLHNPTNEKVQS